MELPHEKMGPPREKMDSPRQPRVLLRPTVWCVCGGLSRNRVGELYSLVQFVRLDPYCFYFCKVDGCDCKCREYCFDAEYRCGALMQRPPLMTPSVSHSPTGTLILTCLPVPDCQALPVLRALAVATLLALQQRRGQPDQEVWVRRRWQDGVRHSQAECSRPATAPSHQGRSSG